MSHERLSKKGRQGMFVISRVTHYPLAPEKYYWQPATGGCGWSGDKVKGSWRKVNNGRRSLSPIPVKCYWTKAAAKGVMTRNGWKDSVMHTYAIEEI